ncbi:TetR/AcrR family transcriptional regulator [Sphingosinicella rhizophila]|uniref:TetR/AcrR family transcriptional regulator n=1 Tax=Sphingosinicella rhizophila TaxID=3050082 RepID=A0ABU3QA30_9SPHN|nr:TetR/AcrR family transcriptional regulator [Sphingosinicella sp. GR2756]MDT9600226.1 TetR/AcrR family transcriptional regulator [Sphingosinicella sp. GR2756]
MTTATSAAAEANVGLSTEDWLDVARETLIREGVEAVKIDRLAKACGVTRGGFYWRFKSREDLLDQLLEDWRRTNTAPMLDALNAAGTPQKRFENLMGLWLEERSYRPDYDTAIRNWALKSPKVAALVREVDDIRIAALHRLFLDGGYDDAEAFIRARVTYYHQVGYYAMGVKESNRRREELRPLYYSVLTGFTNG